jgi:branched-chain amino acid transport system substrate-binding protein
VKADCVIQTGEIENNAFQLVNDVAAVRRSARLYGGDGVCLDFGLSNAAAKRFRCTIATLAPDAFPPAGRQFFANYSARYNQKHPDPYAIYGYESMALLLDAIQRSMPAPGGGPYEDPNAKVTREGVVAAMFATKDRESVLGRYSIDANGDTTLTDYGLYRIKSKQLTFERVVTAAP